jgi:hypothetical protein
MPSKLGESRNLVNGVVDKLKESEKLAKTLKFSWPKRFVALNVLDYILTQVSPRTIAEYQNLRKYEKYNRH